MYVYVCKTHHLKIFEVPFPFESHRFPYRFSRFRTSIRTTRNRFGTGSNTTYLLIHFVYLFFLKHIFSSKLSPYLSIFFLFKSPYPLPRRHQEGEDHVGRVGHALGDPAGDDGRGGRTEGPLEEPVQGTRGGLQLTLGPKAPLGFGGLDGLF